MAKIALFIVLVSMIMIHSAQVVVSDNEPSAAPIADVVAVAGPVSGSESSPAPAPTPETTTKNSKDEKRERHDEGKEREHGVQRVASLFVENIPEAMQWKGLWHSFARHGEVVDVYIARKRSRGGKRFGFVRMSGKEDADRVIERLHGFKLYGSNLIVKLARNNQKHRGRFVGRNGERVEEFNSKEWGKNVKQGSREDGIVNEAGDLNSPIWVKKKRITGHVEEEDLWLLLPV
ncbi:hypothetical protein V6N13_069461 [Hibiscus sabdariffa]